MLVQSLFIQNAFLTSHSPRTRVDTFQKLSLVAIEVSSITLKKSSLLFLLVAHVVYDFSLNPGTWVHKMRKGGRHGELAFARYICQDTRIIGQTHAKQIYKIHDHNWNSKTKKSAGIVTQETAMMGREYAASRTYESYTRKRNCPFFLREAVKRKWQGHTKRRRLDSATSIGNVAIILVI